MFLDLCVPGLHKFRLQYPRSQPTFESYRTLGPVLLQNLVITLGLFSPICYVLYPAMGVELHYPGLLWLGFDVLVMALVYDSWFYVTHRIFHLPWLYKFTHKVSLQPPVAAGHAKN